MMNLRKLQLSLLINGVLIVNRLSPLPQKFTGFIKRGYVKYICYALLLFLISTSAICCINAVSAKKAQESELHALKMVSDEKLKLALEEEEKAAIEKAAIQVAQQEEKSRLVQAERMRFAEMLRLKSEEQEKAAATYEARNDAEKKAREMQIAAEHADKIKLDKEEKTVQANAIPPLKDEEAAPTNSTLAVQLEVSNILQNPELPNGCESTALAIILRYKGFTVSKTDIASKYLPKARFYRYGKNRQIASGDPNEYFIGDPFHIRDAYYCFANPVVQAANTYLKEVGSEFVASDITGASEQTLIVKLDDGTPIATWATFGMKNATFYHDKPLIISKQGKEHIPFANLHCFVLTGYDSEFFYFSDPLAGNVKYKRSAFMNAYTQLGQRAMIVE